MKYFTIFFFSIICGNVLIAQQELGLHFMDNLIQATETNPAKFSPYGLNVALGSPYASFYNSRFAPKDIFSEEGNSLVLNPGDLIAQLDGSTNFIQTNLAVHSLTLGLTYDHYQLSFSHAVKMASYVNYPKGIASLLFNGNGNAIGEKINIAPQLDMMAYQEYGLGVAIRVNEILSLGTRLKYLIGIASVHTSSSVATIHTGADYYQLTGETDFTLNSSGISFNEDGGIELLGGADNLSKALFTGNRGFAIDLGATVTLGKRFSFKASVLDLGQIRWKDHLSTQTSKGKHSFTGLDVEPMIDNDSLNLRSVVDTLEQVFNFQETQEAFSTSLPGRFYLSARFSPMNGLHLGGLAYGEIFRKKFRPSLALSVQKDFGSILSLGALYAIRNNTYDNIGLNFTLRLIGIQIFGMTDNVIALFDPLKARSTSVRFGLNLAFGRKGKERKR